VVFKDFPIEQASSWARPPLIAGRCAYQQNLRLWKMYNFIFDNQESSRSANAWTKMLDYAGQSGLQADTFNLHGKSGGGRGHQRPAGQTPTARREAARLSLREWARIWARMPHFEQYINYELDQLRTGKTPTRIGRGNSRKYAPTGQNAGKASQILS